MKIRNSLAFALSVVVLVLVASVIFSLISLGFQHLGLAEDAARGGATLVLVFLGSFVWCLIDD